MSSFTFEEKGHKYLLDGKPLTGVTTVLGVIAKPVLIGWAAKQTAEWIRQNAQQHDASPDQAIGSQVWYHVNEENLQEAAKAHTKKKEEAGSKGTDVHALVEGYIKKCISINSGNAILDGQTTRELDRFQNWAVSNNVQFLCSEKRMYSREWWVAGTADFTFIKDGKRYVGDLKTMKKLWDRIPFFQCAAYMKMLEENGEEKYDGSCIVNINKETGELTEHYTYAHEEDKKSFEAALCLYRALNN